ncbi:hypothetical protein DFQ26_003059 [Actinomortierella ambigua]|nr:hypothetical protein DFQ26_003059 [Actinomortierella ambigua]
MADQGQKKQKKKQVKMSLNEFLTDQSTGSWADEMDMLPSAPVDDRDSGYAADRSRGYGGRGAGGFERRDRERDEPRFSRAPVDLPTRPPYTAHIGNLPFDVAEADIEEFFTGCPIANIRIMRDIEDRPKGFGYVEFVTLDALKGAIENSGQNLRGRTVRVSVAEPPREREVREDKTAGEWRRSEPLPPSSPAANRYGGGDRFGSGGPRGGDREWGNRFGGERGERPERAERERERGPEKTDVDNWRRTEPVVAVAPERPAWGGPREPREPREHREHREPREQRDTSWGPPSRPIQQAPTQRKKLDLKPRSSEAAAPSASGASSSSRSNPFGSAKPVDSDEALRRVEERLSREKDAADKARKDRAPRAPRDGKEKDAKEAKAEESEAAPAAETSA